MADHMSGRNSTIARPKIGISKSEVTVITATPSGSLSHSCNIARVKKNSGMELARAAEMGAIPKSKKPKAANNVEPGACGGLEK